MPIVHLTARLHNGQRGRLEGRLAAWLWTHLRRVFPEVFAVTRMPNHPPVVAPVIDADRAHRSLVKVLGALARLVPYPRPIWEPVPPPKIVSPDKVVQEIRYVVLNAAKAGIVSDPLAWPWSTHLDVAGAVADPWVTF